jgi:predicted amidohydrolase YtcJ
MRTAIAPDLILANGRVLTADANNRAFEAVAVKMGRILAVGGSSEMLDLRGALTDVIDLKGRTLIPGLTDPHVHLADDGAASLNKIDVRDFGTNVRSIPHILEVVRAQTREVPAGTWIVGTGSPMQDFRMPKKRFPRREESRRSGAGPSRLDRLQRPRHDRQQPGPGACSSYEGDNSVWRRRHRT